MRGLTLAGHKQTSHHLQQLKTLVNMLKLMLLGLVALPSIFATIPDLNQQWLEDVLKNYYKKEGVQIVKIEPTVFTRHHPGTDITRNTTRVVVRMTFDDGKVNEKSLLVVDKPYYPQHESQVVDELFQNDIRVYQEVLPKMDDALIAYNDADSLWLRPIHLEKYERLVFEDPEAIQYRRHDTVNGQRPTGFLNQEHIKIAVAQLAKFHALSAAMKSKNLYSFEHFDLPQSLKNKEQVDLYAPLFMEFAKILKTTGNQEWEKAAIAIENKAKSIHHDLLDIIKRVDSKFNALQIGAYYVNNMYFRHDHEKKIPLSLKVIDFQNAFWNSPAIDLQFFLNTSPYEQIMTDEQMRDEIVSHYAQHLQSYLRKYSYERAVTVEEIKREIQRTELLGLVYAMTYLKDLYMPSHDIPISQNYDFITIIGGPPTCPIDQKTTSPLYLSIMQKLVQRAKNIRLVQY